ncbi:MAG: hypothetical protein JXC32_13825, partial [Anaerolineae bacterium]|nr:hypothetical protein [Anaerolineae bacterium]
MPARRPLALSSLVLIVLILTLAPVSATPAQPPFTGRAPAQVLPAPESPESLLAPLAAGTAFGVQLYPDEGLQYILNTEVPGDWLDVGDTAGTSYFAGDFVGQDYSRLYVIDASANELHTLDTATGADTPIGACVPVAGHVWSGATGTAGGILYAASTDASSSHLYTVNTVTGAATAVGQITNAPAIIDIAINRDAEMYGVDVVLDSLVQVDPFTGAGSVVGALGFDANYPQGMDFDDASGVLYLAAHSDTAGSGGLRVADTATGSSTLVGPFPDGAEVDAFAFTPPAVQTLANPGFESGLTYWQADGAPFVTGTSHTGSASVQMGGEESWVWQFAYIPLDVIGVTLGYWLTGVSSDSDWDNDIFCGGIWDLTR